MLMYYEPGIQSDILVAQWWEHMGLNGELGEVFSVEFAALGAFMRGMAPPTVLLYEADEKGIWFAVWADRIMSGAFFGIWIRADRRPGLGAPLEPALKLTHEAFDTLFTIYPVLFQATRNPHVVDLAVKLGSKILGEVPFIFDGESAMVTFLTQDAYEAYKESLNEQGRNEDTATSGA